MNEQKNLIMTVILAGLILFGFYYFYEKPKIDSAVRAQAAAIHTPMAQGISPNASATLDRAAALKVDPRIIVEGPSIHGSICLQGGKIDDITLKHYHEKVDPSSPEIQILSPEKSADAYRISFAWHAHDPHILTPNDETLWKVKSADTLTPSTPVTLYWENGQGLVFERTFKIDEKYLFTISQKVINKTDQSFQLTPYSTIERKGTPAIADFFILHEGPIGVFNGKLEEHSYKKLREKHHIETPSQGGWIGITDKYWLTALIPSSHQQFVGRFKTINTHQTDVYTAELVYAPVEVAAQQTVELSEHAFTGAKQVKVLDTYAAAHNIPRFDLAIDFGWFYFLTKPIFSFLDLLHVWLGNFGLSILLLTVLIKLILFPLANKSYRSMAKMKQLQPELLKLKERHGDDRVKMNEAMMELYRKFQINPLAGCLPMVMQIPVFFALYKVLFVTIEMRHAPFFGWIQDLSAPDPTTIFNLFGLIPWDPPSYLMIGLWPIIMGVTMFVQQKLNPQPTDAIQAKVFMFMPIFFTIILAQFSAGLVIYWAWNNLLSMGQQALIMHMEAKNPNKPAVNSNRVKPKWKK
jgi:YidC/Oxa1 family membrane protein insertase